MCPVAQKDFYIVVNYNTYWLSRNNVENLLPIHIGEQGNNYFHRIFAKEVNSFSSVFQTKCTMFEWKVKRLTFIGTTNTWMIIVIIHKVMSNILPYWKFTATLKLVGQLFLYSSSISEWCGLGGCILLPVIVLTSSCQSQFVNLGSCFISLVPSM